MYVCNMPFSNPKRPSFSYVALVQNKKLVDAKTRPAIMYMCVHTHI